MKKVLIIIDMLDDFISEKGVLYCGKGVETVVPNINDLVVSDNYDYIFYACDMHDKDDAEFDMFPQHCIASNITEIKFAKGLEFPKYRFKIIPKTRYNALHNTSLGDYLKRIKPDVVQVAGVCTSICVMDTVSALYHLGYKVEINPNTVYDLTKESHQKAIERMKTLYGIILS